MPTTDPLIAAASDLRILVRLARRKRGTEMEEIWELVAPHRPFVVGYGPDSPQTMRPLLEDCASRAAAAPWFLFASLKDEHWVHFVPSLPNPVSLEQVASETKLEVLARWFDPEENLSIVRHHKRGKLAVEFAARGKRSDPLDIQEFRSSAHKKSFLKGRATVADAVNALFQSLEAPARGIAVHQAKDGFRLIDDEGKALGDEHVEQFSITFLAPLTARENPASVTLRDAIERGDVAEARDALARGASVEFLPDVLVSPLSAAVEEKPEGDWRGVCQALVEAGAPVDGYGWEDPPLCGWIRALRQQEAALIATAQLLLQLGADINARTRHAGLEGPLGDTPLHRAIQWELPELARFLVAQGARVDVVNEDGQTPLDLIAAQIMTQNDARYAELARLLEERNKRAGPPPTSEQADP